MRHCAGLCCCALPSSTRRNSKYCFRRAWEWDRDGTDHVCVCVHVHCDLNGNEQRRGESSSRSMSCKNKKKSFGFKSSLNFDKRYSSTELQKYNLQDNHRKCVRMDQKIWFEFLNAFVFTVTPWFMLLRGRPAVVRLCKVTIFGSWVMCLLWSLKTRFDAIPTQTPLSYADGGGEHELGYCPQYFAGVMHICNDLIFLIRHWLVKCIRAVLCGISAPEIFAPTFFLSFWMRLMTSRATPSSTMDWSGETSNSTST